MRPRNRTRPRMATTDMDDRTVAMGKLRNKCGGVVFM